MGIVIAYQGTLNEPGHRDRLLEDLRHCAARLGWPCQEIGYRVSGIVVSQDPSDSRPPFVEEQVRGVQLLPPGTDPFLLTFNRAGQLVQYTEIPRQLLADRSTSDTYFLESTPWVDTTGQPRTHVLILVLLRRIRTRFMANLRVEDDTRFWQTAECDRLNIVHGVVRTLDPVSGVADALASLGEDPEIVLEPLESWAPAWHLSRSKARAVTQPNLA